MDPITTSAPQHGLHNAALGTLETINMMLPVSWLPIFLYFIDTTSIPARGTLYQDP